MFFTEKEKMLVGRIFKRTHAAGLRACPYWFTAPILKNRKNYDIIFLQKIKRGVLSMGMDIHLRLVKYDEKDNIFKEVELLRQRVSYEKYYYDEKGNKHDIANPYIRASIYEGRNSEMFDGMKHGDDIDGFGCFPMTSIKYSSLDKKLVKELESKANESFYFDFSEINLADMKNYLLEHDEVVDYEADVDWDAGEKAYKKNPIWILFENACDYLKFADGDDWNWKPLSDYKLIIYFDW